MSASTRASKHEAWDPEVTPVSREDASAVAVSATRARLALVQQSRRDAIYAARRERSNRATDPGLGPLQPARAQLDTLPDSGAPAPRPAPPKGNPVALVMAVLAALGTLATAVQQLISALGH